MSTLIIIRGNSGSGKTSVSKRLQEKLGNNTMLISQDVVRREILKVKDGKNTPALKLLIEMIRYGKNNCDYVILEGILNSNWYRPLFEEAISEYKENIFAYYYDLPFEETLARHQSKSNSNDFGEEAMRRWWVEKDYIKIIPEITLTSELSLDQTVEYLYQEIKSPIELFIESKVLPKYRPIVEKFRRLIQNDYPSLKEEMRSGTEKYYGVPVYRYNRIIITLSPTQKCITFSFSDGKKLEDKYLLLEGKGNKTLNLRISKLEDYKDEILKYYIDQAIKLDASIK